MSEVPPVADFVALETAVREHWAAHDIFARSVSERDGRPAYVFFEGPPTANGRPGLHHVWARVYKDLFCRFWTMRGRKVLRRAGWDAHGLAVEVEVEKRLGFSGKDEIEAYGVAEFVERCRESVHAYVGEWERLTDRIGFWLDTDAAYWTSSPDYVQSVWWHLRQLWDKGLLFEDVKVVPYCPRCGTALSSHELAQPDVYSDEEDLSAYIRFRIVGPAPGGATELLVWTTTPWTLPSNTAVAVRAELNYLVVDAMVVAESRAEAVLGADAAARATGRLRGEDLVGLRYEPPFDLVTGGDRADGWRIVAAEFVTGDEGTGLVHVAPAFGADDWALGRAENLPTLNPVGPDGRFTTAAGWLAGRSVRDANADILARLEADDRLLRAEPYVHAYPHCWRCHAPLIYWGKPSWYVATSSHKADLIAANEGVTWRPEHVKHGRFGEWLAHNVDWALSRDRYWGTPLPIWRCANAHVRCVASLTELSELAGHDLTGVDPHRPAIDEVTFACPDCGTTSRRVEAVIDAWFDSGSMPAAQWGYPEAPGSAERFISPADFIAEGVDQTRGWFYSLLAVGVLVFGEAPYRGALSLGHIVDADGRKMSKSVGNVIDPWEILDTRGTDPLRWWMFHQGSPWTATRTSLEAIDASTAGTLMTLRHTLEFFSTYATLNAFEPGDPAIPASGERPVLDRWLRSRLHACIARVTTSLEQYEPLEAADALASFVDDLSNWYVRRSRRRFWRTDPGVGPSDSLAAHATLHEALVAIALLIAPFCPFLGDHLWRELTDAPVGASVHLAPWPSQDVSAIDVQLDQEMEVARRIVSLGRSARSRAGVKVRQPLRRAIVVLPPNSPELLRGLIAEELNVDEVVVAAAMGELLTFELVPNFRLLGPRLGGAVKELTSALSGIDALAFATTLEEAGVARLDLPTGTVQLSAGEIEVRVRAKAGFSVSHEGTEAVALDLELDSELLRRGLLREVVRQIQELRRDLGLAVSDRITLFLSGVDELADRRAALADEVLATEVSFRAGEGEGSVLDTGDGRDARAWVKLS